MRRPLARIRGGCALVCVALVVGVTGCSSSGGSGPEVDDSDAVPSSAAPVQALTVTPGQTWGDGRAVSAQRLPSGGLAVVTTTGVFLVDPAAPEPVRIDTFDAAVQIGTTALAPDGVTLAVAAVSPPLVRLYNLTQRANVGSYELRADAQPRSLTFDSSGTRLLVDTTTGPFLVPDRSSPPQMLLDAPTAGSSTMLGDATILTPISGSTDIVLNGTGGAERRSLTLPEGGTVFDAQSGGPSGLVVVSTDIPVADSDPTTQFVLLDPSGSNQQSTIDTGRAISSWQWTVTAGAVVVADGSNIVAWTSDGQATPASSGLASPITELHGAAGGAVSVHADGTVVYWPSGTWSPQVLRPGGTTLVDLVIDSTGAVASAVDFFGAVQAWNLTDGSALAGDDQFAVGEATDVAVSVDGTQVGVSSTSGRVAVLDQTLADVWAFQASDTPEIVGAVSFDPASGGIATGLAQREGATSFDDTVTLWDQQQQAPRFKAGGEREDVDGCSFFYSRIRYSNDATMMAVTSHDFSVQVLDIATGAVLHVLPGTTAVLDLAFSPDDDLLVATYDDGTVNVWQTTDFSLAATYRGAPGGYFAIAVMPDSATLAVTDITGTIGLVDLMTGSPLRTFADAAYRTSTMALSPDGSLLAAPTGDAGIGIWSTNSGERVATMTGHAAAVTGLAFSPQGDWLASSSSDGTVRTWTVNAAG